MTAEEIRQHAEATTPGSLEFFVAELAAQGAELNQILREKTVDVNVVGPLATDLHGIFVAAAAFARRKGKG
jgi:hypothetical protein